MLPVLTTISPFCTNPSFFNISEKEFILQIPKGTPNHFKIHFSEKGDKLKGMERGDVIFVIVQVNVIDQTNNNKFQNNN